MSSQPLTSNDHLGAAGRLVVGVADAIVSATPDVRIITYALGSCLAVTVHDPVTGVGGMLHVMLPDSAIDTAKAAANPSMFVDTGVPRLFREAYRLGGRKERMIVKVAGGASVRGDADMFEIGKRNFVALRKILWKNGVMIKAQDVGGAVSRTVTLDVATGGVTLRVNGADSQL